MACDPQIEPNNQWAAEFMKIAARLRETLP